MPGLIVVQHAGGGKANQYFLRGFDNDHGTDLAISVDGVPTNIVSHAHGQGYADLHYLIPELVSLVEVRKGPYFLEYGDLAVSGAVNLVLPDRLQKSTVRFTGGQFGVRRGVAMLQLPTESFDAWVAGEGYAEDGPFDNPERPAALQRRRPPRDRLRPEPRRAHRVVVLWRLERLRPDPAPPRRGRPPRPLRDARP